MKCEKCKKDIDRADIMNRGKMRTCEVFHIRAELIDDERTDPIDHGYFHQMVFANEKLYAVIEDEKGYLRMYHYDYIRFTS